MDLAEDYLALPNTQSRRAWLNQHAPVPNLDLINLLAKQATQQSMQNPQAMLPIAQAIADAANFWDDNQTRAVALHIKAEVCRLTAEHKQALGLYEEAEDLYRSLDMELEAARVAVGQFATLQLLGHYDQALSLARWASDVFKVAGDQNALSKMLMNRGNVHARLGQFAEARTLYSQARTIFRDNNNARYLAILDVNDAIALTYLDDFREAEKLYQSAQIYFAEQKMSNYVAHSSLNLGYLYFAQGNYQQSLRALKRAKQIYTQQENSIDLAYVDLHRSDNYLALNLWQESLETARAARDIFAEADMPYETAVLWLNEAVALAHMPNQQPPDILWDEARKHFQQAGSELWQAMTDIYQANIEIRAGQMDAARTRTQQARVIFRQNELRGRTAHCDVLLGNIALHNGELSQAIYHFDQAQKQLAHADVAAVAYACHYGLGQAAVQQENFAQAHTHFQKAVAYIERLQAAIGSEDYKIAFFSDKLQVYEALVQLCLTQDTPAIAEAFEISEQAKSRALLDTMARGNRPSKTKRESELTQQKNRLKQELNWYYNRLNEPQPDAAPLTPQQISDMTDAITRREHALGKLIKQWRSPDLANAPNNPIWTVTLEQIQSLMPESSLLLAYFIAQGDIFVFGIRKNEIWAVPLTATEAEITAAMDDLHFQFNKFQYGEAYQKRHAASMRRMADEALSRLHEMLIAPFVERLAETEALVIIPHRHLHAVPFHALFDGQNYLIDRHTVSYAPSTTILYRTLTMETAVTEQPPLIMGIDDPIIPQAIAEAESLAQLFPRADLYLGQAARTEHLTKPTQSPTFLHLSTHATFRADNPLFSGLKLANGWLDVNDIYDLKMSPPLVTLSACETGRTQLSVGDEFEGLSRGFFASGAKTMLMSMWMAEDEATAQLMTHFYKNLLNGYHANSALNKAQQTIKQTHPHPFHWATFMLTGNHRFRLEK